MNVVIVSIRLKNSWCQLDTQKISQNKALTQIITKVAQKSILFLTKRKTLRRITSSREATLKLTKNQNWYSILPIKEALQGLKSKVRSQTKSPLIILVAEAKENLEYPNRSWLQSHQKEKSHFWRMTSNEEVITMFLRFQMQAKAKQKAKQNNK